MYTYVYNNPLIYYDPTGNVVFILPLLAAPTLISTLAALATTTGTIAAGIYVNNQINNQKPTVSQQPVVNQAPTVLQQPEVVQQKPVVNQQPVVQQKTTVSQQPVVQQKPTVSQQPVVSQSPSIITSDSGNGYQTPSGGGGVSNSINVGNTRVTFGHGGRRDLGLPTAQVELEIARMLQIK